MAQDSGRRPRIDCFESGAPVSVDRFGADETFGARLACLFRCEMSAIVKGAGGAGGGGRERPARRDPYTAGGAGVRDHAAAQISAIPEGGLIRRIAAIRRPLPDAEA